MWLSGAGLLVAATVIAAARVGFANNFVDPSSELHELQTPYDRYLLQRKGTEISLTDALQLPERSNSKRDLPFTGPIQGPLAYSPPSYPSPWGSGSGDWADAYTKARAIVSQMTLLEKVNLTTGVG